MNYSVYSRQQVILEKMNLQKDFSYSPNTNLRPQYSIFLPRRNHGKPQEHFSCNDQERDCEAVQRKFPH